MKYQKGKSLYEKPILSTHDSVKKITKAVTTGSADGDFGQF
jgi:hypothetical protein